MNILFFLKPKNELAYIYHDYTVRQVLEKMEYHKYSAIPVINRSGEYIGTITEGDILWGLKNEFDLNLKRAENTPICLFERKWDNSPIYVNSNMEDLLSKVMNQNFVPVIDDNNIFIGIITRKEILMYCNKQHFFDVNNYNFENKNTVNILQSGLFQEA